MFVEVEYKATITSRRRACRAATLLETLIAITLVALLVGAIVSISLSSGRSFAEIMNYIDLGRDNRVALDKITREVRQMRYLSAFQTNSLSFVDQDGANVRFDYVPATRSLLRTKDGLQSTLLTECDALQFAIYERAPLTNTFDLMPATEATNCKVVGLTWKCSRKILGLRANTESGQAARIVLRGKQY